MAKFLGRKPELIPIRGILNFFKKMEGSIEPYRSSWEHLSAELNRLDLRIQGKLRLCNRCLSDYFGHEYGEWVSTPNLAWNGDSQVTQIDSHLKIVDTELDMRRKRSEAEGVYLSLPYLASIFNLSPLEEQVLLICLAPEIDRKYEKIYGLLQGEIVPKQASVAMILEMLAANREEKMALRRVLGPQGPLLKFLLYAPRQGEVLDTPWFDRYLKLDERICNFLLDLPELDSRIEGRVQVIFPDTPLQPAPIITGDYQLIYERIRAVCERHKEKEKRIVFHFYGPNGAGKKFLAGMICRELGLPLLKADLSKIAGNLAPDFLHLLGREVVLQGAALELSNMEGFMNSQDHRGEDWDELVRMIHVFSPLTFLISNQACGWRRFFQEDLFWEQEFTTPPERVRRVFWENFSKEYPQTPGVDYARLAGDFRFTPGQIRDTLKVAEQTVLIRSSEDSGITEIDLYQACYQQADRNLGLLTKKMKPIYGWEDIVLPPEQKQQLREICNQVRYRRVVYEEWGFDRQLSLGKGLNVLFTGPPGTGKTMAAEVIANELRLELYKIDLSQLVSKYIGETEKNINKIFQTAQTSNALLFFDEADALFGKRSEVKDAHDRYANLEVAYLLQQVEEYDGITILASNLRNNIDPAFTRRLRFIVEFALPDESCREQIWKKAFPQALPRNEGVNPWFLAKKYQLSGANIKNIVLSAAFLAAATTGILNMEHITKAAERELRKMGRIPN